jgi:hypothetical protein
MHIFNPSVQTLMVSTSAFFLKKKMFRGTLRLTQENHNFIVQIGKKKSSKWTKLAVCLAGILPF